MKLRNHNMLGFIINYVVVVVVVVSEEGRMTIVEEGAFILMIKSRVYLCMNIFIPEYNQPIYIILHP